MSVTVRFCGAARTVTGSSYLFQTAAGRFLVDFPRVFRGTHLEIPRVESFRGRVVEVETVGSGLELDVYASGERVGPLPARIECEAGALRLMVPPATA